MRLLPSYILLSHKGLEREKTPQDFKIRKHCLDLVWLQTFVAKQLLDNFSKLGYLLPGASKSWLPWNLQNVIGEKEFSFEPEKTAWKRRLQLFELVLVLLLNVEFFQAGFWPPFPSRCQTYILVEKIDEKWDCWCAHGVSGSWIFSG